MLITKTTPWPHQIEAAEYALGTDGAAIFVRMGGGKTKIMIDVLNTAGCRLILIISLKISLVEGLWQKEFSKHSHDDYQLLILDEGTSEDKAKLLSLHLHQDYSQKGLVVIVNHESVWRKSLGAIIMKTVWDCVVLDEAHRISHPGSKISRFMAAFPKGRAIKRIALTGSPFAHSPLGVYAIFKFVNPAVFGTNYQSFKDQYAIMGGYNNYQIVGYKNLDKLREILKRFAYYADPNKFLELPEISHYKVKVQLEKEAEAVYRQFKKDMLVEVNGESLSASNTLVKLLRLQQMAGGFLTSDNGNITRISTAKLDALREILMGISRDIVPGMNLLRHAPVVVFARFLSEIEAIRKIGEELDYVVGEVSGARKNLDLWAAGICDLLVVQTRSGSESIDLTRSHYAIFYSKEFGLGLFEQAVARLHRPGQKNPVICYHLVASSTVDTRIEVAIEAKMDVANYLIETFLQEDPV